MDTKKSGWHTYRFDQIAENVNVRVDDPSEADVDIYVGLEHLDPESLKIRRWGEPEDVSATKLRFWPGDIVFGRRRFYQRKLAVAEFEGICSAHAMVLRAREDVGVPEFLPFFMQSETFYERAMAISVGSLSPTINWKTLARQEFALPPKDEQRRIAEILWAVEDNIESHLKLLAESERFKDTLRVHLLSFGVISSAHRDSIERKKTKVGLIPENWTVATLNEVCEAIVDCPHTTPNYVDSGVRVVRNFNIVEGHLVGSESFTTEEEYLERIRRLEPKPGDVLFSREAPAGEACVMPEGTRLSLGQRTMMFRPKTDVLNSRFLVHTIYHPRIKQRMKALETGTTAKHLNVQDMRNLRIALPPFEEQEAMVELLDSSEHAIRKVKEKLDTLASLKKALLNIFLNARSVK
jgi:type I restriction enzyme S subunit